MERAADSVNANPKLGDSTHRSPVVFGTRAYDQLWAQAKAMGDAAEETGTPPLEDEDDIWLTQSTHSVRAQTLQTRGAQAGALQGRQFP